MEIYKNNFTGTDWNNVLLYVRSGPVMVWENTATGYPRASAAILNNFRTMGQYVFGGADGTNPWDVNHPGNPQAAFVASANSTNDTTTKSQTVTVAGAAWVPNQWSGYSLHKSGCVPTSSLKPCGLLVMSNTSDTITYAYIFPGTQLDLASGDRFTLNLITHVLDAPCRSGGTRLQGKAISSVTSTGTTAWVTLPNHGYVTGDHIDIWETSPQEYRGTFRISVVDTNTFSYTLGKTVSSPATYAGTATKLPHGWNNQVMDPCYQWLNTERGQNIAFHPAWYFTQIRSNEHYFDYDPAKPFDGMVGPNRSSIGVGSAANRPAVCMKGAAYWATDEGDWDSTKMGPEGRLYVCADTNIWTVYYMPYSYPHPLTKTD
jgi:hypothetical protein